MRRMYGKSRRVGSSRSTCEAARPPMTSVSAPPSRMMRGSAKERPSQLLALVGHQPQPGVLRAEQDAALDLARHMAGRAGDLGGDGDGVLADRAHHAQRERAVGVEQLAGEAE